MPLSDSDYSYDGGVISFYLFFSFTKITQKESSMIYVLIT